MNSVRIDTYLWATRVFKTRTLAQEAIKKNRVKINQVAAKPSRLVLPGDVISVQRPPVTFTFKVIQVVAKRLGAKLVSEYLQNITDPKEYEVLEMQKISGFVDRAKGLGRPTKKERRDLEQFYDDSSLDETSWDNW